MVSVTITTTEKSILKHTLLVNDRIIVIDEQYEYTWLSDDTYSFVVAIPEKYLTKGMNEINLIVTFDIKGASYIFAKLLYRCGLSKETISWDSNMIQVINNKDSGLTSIYVNSGIDGKSYFMAMLNSATGRNIYCIMDKESMKSLTVGNGTVDKRFIIRMIVTEITCNNKVYSFYQQHYIGGTY